jgi:hypothetical protein
MSDNTPEAVLAGALATGIALGAVGYAPSAYHAPAKRPTPKPAKRLAKPFKYEHQAPSSYVFSPREHKAARGQRASSLERTARTAGSIEKMPYHAIVHDAAQRYAKKYNIADKAPELEKIAYSIMWQESSLRKDVIGSCGEFGLMQHYDPKISEKEGILRTKKGCISTPTQRQALRQKYGYMLEPRRNINQGLQRIARDYAKVYGKLGQFRSSDDIRKWTYVGHNGGTGLVDWGLRKNFRNPYFKVLGNGPLFYPSATSKYVPSVESHYKTLDRILPPESTTYSMTGLPATLFNSNAYRA